MCVLDKGVLDDLLVVLQYVLRFPLMMENLHTSTYTPFGSWMLRCADGDLDVFFAVYSKRLCFSSTWSCRIGCFSPHVSLHQCCCSHQCLFPSSTMEEYLFEQWSSTCFNNGLKDMIVMFSTSFVSFVLPQAISLCLYASRHYIKDLEHNFVTVGIFVEFNVLRKFEVNV